MSEVSIKVSLGNRTYPLSVNAGEEELIRAAAHEVNESLRALQENYAVKDIQDLLAMTALQMATQMISQRNTSGNDKSAPVADQAGLAEVNQLLEGYLSKL
jgi:cell division protein ZapA (FtsZ GTPase activity inhibitor)